MRHLASLAVLASLGLCARPATAQTTTPAASAEPLAPAIHALHLQACHLAQALGMDQRPRTRADLDRLRALDHDAARLAASPASSPLRRRALLGALPGAQATLTRLRAARAAGRPQAFALAVEGPDVPVFLAAGQLSSRFATSYTMVAARAEAESFQAVVVPTEGPVPEVRWQLAAPRDAQGHSLPASVRLVGHVNCPPAAYPVSQAGWWPDPLLDTPAVPPSVPRGEVLPLWVTVTAPREALPGVYRGRLSVTARGMPARSVAFTVRVLPFTLPATSTLPAVVSVRALPRGMYPAASVPRILRQTEDRLLGSYRLSPASLYGGVPRWDAARLGQLKALGLSAVCVGYANAPLGTAFDAAWLTDGLAARLQGVRAFLETASAAGLADRCFLFGFDERPAGDLTPVYQAASQVQALIPGLSFMTTARDPDLGLSRADGTAVDTWALPLPEFDPRAEVVARARAAGRRVWWYLSDASHPPYPNWFVESGPLEARLTTGLLAAHYQPDGILYYAANRWPAAAAPLTDGPRTAFAPQTSPGYNGDGCLLYPGPGGLLGSIRLEAIRDGLEDFEYYALLRSLLQKAHLSPKAADVPASLVGDLSHFSRDPRALARERLRLARLITALQSRLERAAPAAPPKPRTGPGEQGGAPRPEGNSPPQPAPPGS